ncbi:MAG: hypothetical protein ABSD31_07290 [Candidatus Binataceae bacterium]|jgi:caa(3)-type oxidase subunit IV
MEQAISGASDVLKTFAILVGLLIVGVLTVALRIPGEMALVVIFGAALIEACIVGRRYMRLRSEDALIYILALVPVLMLIGFAISLVPDIVRRK